MVNFIIGKNFISAGVLWTLWKTRNVVMVFKDKIVAASAMLASKESREVEARSDRSINKLGEKVTMR
jgi:hypothetical protein